MVIFLISDLLQENAVALLRIKIRTGKRDGIPFRRRSGFGGQAKRLACIIPLEEVKKSDTIRPESQPTRFWRAPFKESVHRSSLWFSPVLSGALFQVGEPPLAAPYNQQA
ncbi:hypothetical protein A3C17_03105 [Candidatus Uhrbacteria bacterium RIFCSPHIGHO2_02_FULL_53_13]|uniref:Uncharacterized protein n=1 Tax=Candidatus Uhrbacteria bacterium RIFCSPHIGHO2_02_FULL_53_13 TaxID=1802389 RepID=A0A1F7TZJ6_9BACT|nr:MAG: hypothetical protein A3C17_03105 [Candidatus Uhrbacteria bacterium RIFCSPHIGHO2_02_FULL_53_13]